MKRLTPRDFTRYDLLKILEGNVFNILVIILVALDTSFFVIEEEEGENGAVSRSAYFGVGLTVVLFFVFEMTAKLYCYGIKQFFQVSWNIIDMFIVIINLKENDSLNLDKI
eukprot:c18581_g1_i1.p1 GENE.c18581_g1_i1~~c18581_g1_i1.p1  ORF type:complete len:122 (+),score=37.64 c18581_g1_i1:35-367(+)